MSTIWQDANSFIAEHRDRAVEDALSDPSELARDRLLRHAGAGVADLGRHGITLARQPERLIYDEALKTRFNEFRHRHGWTCSSISADMRHRLSGTVPGAAGFQPPPASGPATDSDQLTGLSRTTIYLYAAGKWPGSQDSLTGLESRIEIWLDLVERWSAGRIVPEPAAPSNVEPP